MDIKWHASLLDEQKFFVRGKRRTVWYNMKVECEGKTMYDYLKGQVTRITPEYIVLEAARYWLELYTPNPFAFRT